MIEVINLIQGDDSNALGDKIVINLTSQLDLTGFKAVFQLEDYKLKWDDITSKKLEVIIPRSVTEKLTVGTHKAGLKIYDNKGLAKTIIKDIRVCVSRGVVGNV